MSDDQNPNPNKEKPSFYSDTRKTIRILIVTLSFIGAFAWANLSLNTFTSGTTISSNQMNANFQALENAIVSNLVFKNQTSFTITDGTSCTQSRHVLKFDGSGPEVANYNATTGEFSFTEGGLYQVSYLLKCDSCSKKYVHLCADIDQALDCETESKPTQTTLGEFNSVANSGSRFVNIDAGKVYKLLVDLCKDTMNIASAGTTQIYIKKMR